MGDKTNEPATSSNDGASAPAVSRFSELPARILPEDMVEEVAADTAKDPDFGRDPDRDWLLRTS